MENPGTSDMPIPMVITTPKTHGVYPEILEDESLRTYLLTLKSSAD